jgi:hypothetical protein
MTATRPVFALACCAANGTPTELEHPGFHTKDDAGAALVTHGYRKVQFNLWRMDTPEGPSFACVVDTTGYV